MKAEKQHRELQSGLIQPKRNGSKLSFVDNRSQAASQLKLVQSIQKREDGIYSEKRQQLLPEQSEVKKCKENGEEPLKTEFVLQLCKYKFTLQEDKAIIDNVIIYGHNWKQIAMIFPTRRSARQIRERYNNYLSPKLSTTWTTEEDCLLMEKYTELGPKWAMIARYFQDRTDIQIKNRFYHLRKTSTSIFEVAGIDFSIPQTPYTFTSTSALNATKPMLLGGWTTLTGAARRSGVKIGNCGSYGAVQHLEMIGDGLTGDHQPSGAAIKEAIRLQLHASLDQVLTRGMAQVAYKNAITVVVSDTWHRLSSRTYGGRNTPTQIKADALDLLTASMEDWKMLVPELKKMMTDQEIQNIWDGLCQLRENFFSTGDPQWL